MIRLVTSALFFVAGVAIAQSDDPAAPAAPDRSFAVDRFDAVSLDGVDNVRIATGPFSVTANGDPRAVAALRVGVRGGVLHIDRRSGRYNDRGATVAVRMPALRAVTIAGSGNVTTGPVATNAFIGRVPGSGTLRIAALRAGDARIALDGSGDVLVDGVEAAALALSLDGSGNIRAAGRAARVTARLAGSGSIDGRRLATPALSVDLSGSGNVAAQASERADIRADGSGGVTVTGGAKCTVTKNDMASVRCG